MSLQMALTAETTLAPVRSVLGELLPDLSRTLQTGTFGMRFERDVIMARPTLLTHHGHRLSHVER